MLRSPNCARSARAHRLAWAGAGGSLLLFAGMLASVAPPAAADTSPTLSIAGTSVARSAGGPVTAYFEVTLSSVQTTPVTFDYATSDGTATAGVDYKATSGSWTMQAGAIRKKLGVICYGVSKKHPETGNAKVQFTMTISNAVGATIETATATATILQIPAISIGDASAVQSLTRQKNDPDNPPVKELFTISISPTIGKPVTVDYVTSNGTATSGVDYKATDRSVVIPADASGVKVGIAVKPANAKSYVPTSEITNFYVTISTPTGGIYTTRARGTATIYENVPPGAPTDVSATPDSPGAGTVELSWSSPTDTGNSPIASYAYTSSFDGGNTFGAQQDVGTATSVDTSCPTGDSCVFEVYATNGYSQGSGATSSAVTGP